jgi:phospho-N-acetylmuramoyl-pentapeptide-transferase
MYESLVVFLIAFAVSAVLGPPIIRALRRLKIGQKILEDGPIWHMKKQDSPTMGGFIFFAGIIAALGVMLFAALFVFGIEVSERALLILAMATAFGVIGFIDDWCKVKKKQNKGLTVKQKFLLQLAVSILFITLMRTQGLLTNTITIPFVNINFTVPWVVYFVFMSFIIIGADNAVNITDGIDGLASSVTFAVMAFFFSAALFFGDGKLALLPAAVCGGLGGFLIYNFNPAKVFMGDTGSLFLGGLVAGMAFAIDLPLILIPIGICDIIEALSVIIQVGYFKISGGKRVFKMAPIHHHFEMCGYSEKQIVAAAFTITAVMCIVSYLWGIG